LCVAEPSGADPVNENTYRPTKLMYCVKLEGQEEEESHCITQKFRKCDLMQP